jgi:hypothetical protein
MKDRRLESAAPIESYFDRTPQPFGGVRGTRSSRPHWRPSRYPTLFTDRQRVPAPSTGAGQGGGEVPRHSWFQPLFASGSGFYAFESPFLRRG